MSADPENPKDRSDQGIASAGKVARSETSNSESGTSSTEADVASPAPLVVDIAALEEYFQSIKELFHETRVGLVKDNKGVNDAFIFFFVLSLIPLIPLVLSKLVWRYFGSTVISIRTIRFHFGSFWFWWVVLFIISLLTLLIAVKLSGVSAKEKKKWLSPPQMRFAYCYAIVNEIGKYRTNQLGRHIDAALDYLDEIAASLFPAMGLPFSPYPDPYLRREIYASRHQVGLMENGLTNPPKWYRLRRETELILKAFGEFVPKLRDRLKDRKDLPAVEATLTYLAAYQYLEIPELSSSMSGARFEDEMRSLLSFAARMAALPSYRSEELKPTPKEKLSLKFFTTLSKVTAPFSHENQVVAFLFWLVFLFLLFGGGFWVVLRLFSIKVDSTVITTLIGGPILGALTAVIIPRVGRKNTGN